MSIKNGAARGAKAVPCNDLFTLDYRAQAESQETQLFLFVLTSVQPSSDTERSPAVSWMSHKGQILFFLVSHTETELSQIWFLQRLEMQPCEFLNVERVVGGPSPDVDKLCDRMRVPHFETLRKLYLGANSSFCLFS